MRSIFALLTLTLFMGSCLFRSKKMSGPFGYDNWPREDFYLPCSPKVLAWLENAKFDPSAYHCGNVTVPLFTMTLTEVACRCPFFIFLPKKVTTIRYPSF